jgi:hypothetical protein
MKFSRKSASFLPRQRQIAAFPGSGGIIPGSGKTISGFLRSAFLPSDWLYMIFCECERARYEELPDLSRFHGNLRKSSGARADLSRRRLLLSIALGAAAGGAPSPSAAQHKASQAEALYQDRPKNGFSCAGCALFRPPAACVVVAGAVSADGWCRFFDLPD